MQEDLKILTQSTRMWALGLCQSEALNAMGRRFHGPNAPVALKGASLLGRIYHSPLERPMTDIDLWAPSGTIWEETRAGLFDLGYRPLNPGAESAGREHWGFNTYGPEIVVELHAHIGPGGIIGEDIFKTCLPHPKFEGLRHLPVEEEFVYLCWHYAGQHTFLERKWGEDLARFLGLYKHINGKKVAALASEWQMQKSVEGACVCLEQIFKIKLPQELRPALFLPLDENFIDNPKSDMVRYLAIKWLMRENLRQSVSEGARAIRTALTFP